MMASEDQLDTIRRIILTHFVNESDILRIVQKPFECLSEAEATKVIRSLSDGEFGGISSDEAGGRYTQDTAIRSLAALVCDPLAVDLDAFIWKLCPVVGMDKRQKARVIVELDRIVSGSLHEAVPEEVR